MDIGVLELSNSLISNGWVEVHTQNAQVRCVKCNGPVSRGAATIIKHFELAHQSFLNSYKRERIAHKDPIAFYHDLLKERLKGALR